MAAFEQWVRHPQSVWLRRTLFQIHLWTGIGIGLYVLMISFTGAVIVYQNELYTVLSRGPVIVTVTDHRLTHDEIKAIAQKDYPTYTIQWIFESSKPNGPTDIWMARGSSQKKRLFDPYTGQDLGNSVPFGLPIVSWMVDFHTNLLAGDTGRLINGVGAMFVTVLAITGLVIWWPGVQNWRKSLTIRRTDSWKRFNWDLHSAMGIWALAFVLLWGVTGVYLVFPKPFERAVNFFTPVSQFRGQAPAPTESEGRIDPGPGITRETDKDGNIRVTIRPGLVRRPQRLGDRIVRSFTTSHFGTFGGNPIKVIWVLFGLTPALLFVTGFLMWWNRVLAPLLRRAPAIKTQLKQVAEAD